ncbi:hypothetical protein DMA11_04750 [Marinilabiliaceae bacterium JC017]|nr:hypothetical protein DMA11_04750 [Marinilabiliaceae bacterium JC017]
MRNNIGSGTWMRPFLFWMLLITLSLLNACRTDEEIRPMEDPQADQLKNYALDENLYGGTYSGGQWVLALPPLWNALPVEQRNLLIYAHGIVDPDEDPALPDDEIGGRPVAEIILGMQWAFATTSYRETGLVVKEAVQDVKALMVLLNTLFGDGTVKPPGYIFLAGPSEGGLVTVKTIEKYPNHFDGAIATCGPYGNFYRQLQYNGDFHVLFNYFFAAELSALGIDLGDPENGVPSTTRTAWKHSNLRDVLKGMMASRPNKVVQLVKCSKATVNPDEPEAVLDALLDILRYNIMFTDQVNEKFEGVIFNNARRWYRGSNNDFHLNRYIQRVSTTDYRRAVAKARYYETSGRIRDPLVTMHTTGDHVVPIWHQLLYRLKILFKGSSRDYVGIPVPNYGHCTFEESHVMAAIVIMYLKATGTLLYEIPASAFSNEESKTMFKSICTDEGYGVTFDEE